MSKPPQAGDYILATKYMDGHPQNHWVVGFYDSQIRDRHHVVDGHGRRFRHNGFRRVAKIRRVEGAALLKDVKAIEYSGRSLWGHLRRVRRELKAAKPT